mmetsp:Transcript_92345/g.183902  ORF Transcript_92345/g.183902 Transcript_92345/m.183902 type:complete len:104 (+) Transcript_92345:555-866(+)
MFQMTSAPTIDPISIYFATFLCASSTSNTNKNNDISISRRRQNTGWGMCLMTAVVKKAPALSLGEDLPLQLTQTMKWALRSFQVFHVNPNKTRRTWYRGRRIM